MKGQRFPALGNRRFLVFFGGIWLSSTFANGLVIAPASVFPVIMDSMAIGPTRASWIVSVTLAASALSSVLSGAAVDRVNNRWMVIVGVFVFLGTCLWAWRAALAGSYWSLLLSRAGAGIAIMIIWNGGINMIGAHVSPEYKATAIGAFAASAPGGFAIAQYLSPVITGLTGWPAIFPVFGAVCVVGLLVFWPVSRAFDVEHGKVQTPRFADFRRVFTSRHVWHVSLMGFMAFTLYAFLNSWMPSYLVDVYGLSLAESGLLVAVFPAVGIVSRSGGGFLSDVLFDGCRRPVALLAFGVSAPALGVLFFAPTATVLVGALITIGLFIQFGMGLFLTYIRELVDQNVNATAVAFLSGVAIFGAFTAPTVGGMILERTGTYAAAFSYAGVVAVVGCLLAWFAPEPG